MFSITKEKNHKIEISPKLNKLNRKQLTNLREDNFRKMILEARSSNNLSKMYPNLDEIDSVEDISVLPVLTPSQLAKLCPPKSNSLLFNEQDSGLVIRTSGTTSKPRYMYHSWGFTNQVGQLGARGLASLDHDQTLFKKIGNCLLPGDLNGSFAFGQDIFQKLSALTFPFGTQLDKDELIKQITYHKIDTLIGFPSVISDLFKNENMANSSVKNILFLGEAFGNRRKSEVQKIKPSVLIKALAYSTSETGPVGYQCHSTEDQTFHIHEDSVIVEIVDEINEEPVPSGIEGKILITALSTTGMALFRYDIGDRGYIEESACSCGDKTSLLKITGRSNSIIVIDGLNISQDHIKEGLKKINIHNTHDCQFILTNYKDGSYDVTLQFREEYNPVIGKDEVLKAFMQTSYHLNRVLLSPRLNKFDIKFNNNFRVTNRGKHSFFSQKEL